MRGDDVMAIYTTTEKVKMLTLKEAAAEVEGLSEFRVRQMCLSGELPYFKAGKKYLVNKRRLLEALGEKFE